MYLIKTPWWLRALYPSFTWKLPVQDKILYLTFDDGPHPTATPFVLDQLKRYNAKASFFCSGNNVKQYPEIYRQIQAEGHAIGNHTYHHKNGWMTDDRSYLEDISLAEAEISSCLFRPPHGRIRRKQALALKERFTIIMWDVLSGDFDIQLSPLQCSANVLYHAEPGSIIVFHDSTKAWDRMSYALPRVLEHFSKQGYRFEAITKK